MQFAYQFPQMAERLVLVCSGGLGKEVNPLLRALSLPGTEYLLPAVLAPQIHSVVGSVGRVLGRFGLRADPFLGEVWNAWSRLTDARAQRAFIHTIRAVIDVAGQRVSARDRLYLADEVPTLIVWGDRDQVIPVSHAHVAHELMPGSRLEIVENAGHFLPFERPELLDRLLRDFLATTTPANVEPPALAGGPHLPRLTGSTPLTVPHMATISYARRFTDLAAADPERVLITCGDESITRAGFESSANRLARDLQARGVGLGDMVTIALPNSIAWFVTAAACWKLGAIPQPVSYRLPAVRAAGHRGAGRLAGRRGRGAASGCPDRAVPAGGPRAAPVDRGRPAARCDVAGVEGADLGWFDRPAEAHRVGRSRLDGPRRPADPRRRARRLPADARAAVPQRSRGLVVHGAARRGPPRRAAALRRRGHPRGHRGALGGRRLPRAHDDEADLAAARSRCASATTCRRCGSCGTSPSRARRGSRRRGSTGSAPTGSGSSTPAPRRRRPRSSRARSGSSTAGSVGRPADGHRADHRRDGTELPPGEQGEVWLRSVDARHAELPLRGCRGARAATAAGSRWATSAGSTPTASSTWATGSPT